MRAARTWLAAGLLTLAVAGGAGACGIPSDRTPEPLEFPPQYQTATTTETPEVATTTGGLTATLCLTRNQRLVPVPRPVEKPPSPGDLLSSLIDGPTDAETQDEGLTSALTGIQGVSVAGIDSGVAKVEVGDSLAAISTADRLLIIGQIVCTIDALDTVTGVRFSQNGQPLPVPRADATSGDEVTAEDYEMLLETSAPSTGP